MKNQNKRLKVQENIERIKKFAPFLGLILIVGFFEAFSNGNLLSSRNLINIFNNFFSIGLCAMAYSFIMAIQELDLSVGAIVGFAATIGAFAGEINMALILPATLISGLFIGLLNGILVAYLKVDSFIGTLAMSFVFRGLTTWLLNGSKGIPIEMRVFDQNIVKITVFLLSLIVLFLLFSYCAYGRRCRAIGASKEAARQSGVRVEFDRMIAFFMCGGLCGLVGFFTLVRACTASSKTGNAFEFSILLAVLFGGMPLTGGWAVKFSSAVIGSVAMAVLKSGMSLIGFDGLTQQLIQGLILVSVVAILFDRKNTAVIK